MTGTHGWNMAGTSFLKIGHLGPFYRFLQPRIIPGLLVLVIVFTFNSADGANTRCTTSKNCTDPEYDYYCDDTLKTCRLCTEECTNPELKGRCLRRCPVRYREVYESPSQGRDKTPAKLPPEDADQPEMEVNKEDDSNDISQEDLTQQQVLQKTKDSGGRNLIVIICVVALALALIPGLAFAWKKRHTEAGQDGQFDPHSTIVIYKKVDDQVSIEEGTNGNGSTEESNTNNEEAIKIGQSPDPLPSEHSRLYVGGDGALSSENVNNPRVGPNANAFNVDSYRSLRAHSYPGSLNSSQNSLSQEDGQ